MALKIEMLRCFSIVAQTGNLAEAANRIGRTQSALSMTLKQLEEHLGERLFESDRKNRLTALGQQVFELSQKQLRQFDETVRTIEASAKAPQGVIRIVSVPSMVGLVFPATLRTLTDQHPGLRIEMRDTDTQNVIAALFQGHADLGVASGDHTLNGVRNRPLFADRFGLICAPEHPLGRQSDDPTIDDVVDAGLVLNDLCGLIETPEFTAATGAARLMAHNTLSLISMVRLGKWVTVLPETVALLAPDDLVFRKIQGLEDRRKVSLFIREKSPFRHLAEQLEELIAAQDWSKFEN